MSANPTSQEPAQDTSTQLVRRIRAGDRSAEAEFVARFQPGVRALVRRHCRPAEPAVDDLAQEVLGSVLERLRAGAIQDEGALPSYVRSAVVFTVRAEYRKRGRRHEDASAEPPEPVDTLDPSRVAQRDALGSTVRSLLDELPVARDRELLRRFYLQEQERDEVCAALGIEHSHFHRVLYRARERLRELLLRAGLGGAG